MRNAWFNFMKMLQLFNSARNNLRWNSAADNRFTVRSLVYCRARITIVRYQFDLIKMQECLLSRGALHRPVRLLDVTRAQETTGRGFVRSAKINVAHRHPSRWHCVRGLYRRPSVVKRAGGGGGEGEAEILPRDGVFLEILFKSFQTETRRPFSEKFARELAP